MDEIILKWYSRGDRIEQLDSANEDIWLSIGWVSSDEPTPIIPQPPDSRVLFNPETCLIDLKDVFISDFLDIKYEALIVQIQMSTRYKDLFTLNQILQVRIQQGIITQQMFDDINNVFKKQNIDLSTIQPPV